MRKLWLRWHAHRHPDHVLVGYFGVPLRCGTCLGTGESLPLEMTPRWVRRRIDRELNP